ncbi:unnamed protein product [Amoebophrya sp. A25]|nr:unnamed protein product [Amoebophrya sp. A25]|eukprot:GSA25T00020172001.1
MNTIRHFFVLDSDCLAIFFILLRSFGNPDNRSGCVKGRELFMEAIQDVLTGLIYGLTRCQRIHVMPCQSVAALFLRYASGIIIFAEWTTNEFPPTFQQSWYAYV